MQGVIRSPLIACTVAVGCAAAIAVAPLAPTAAPLALSSVESGIALSAWNSPITAVIDSGALAFNYLITGTYSTDPVKNWGTASNVGPEWNALLPLQHDSTMGFLPHITAVGVIPNFIQVPFPIATQLVNNWIGYAQYLLQPNGLATIAGDIAAKTSAFVAAVGELWPQFVTVFGYQESVLAASVNSVIANIRTALDSGDMEGIWNAVVDGSLSPRGVPGTLLNLTIGSGVQTDPTDPATFVPSARYLLQMAGQELASALETTLAPPASASLPAALHSAAVEAPGPGAVTSAVAATPAATRASADTGGAAAAGSYRGPRPAAKATGGRATARAAAAR